MLNLRQIGSDSEDVTSGVDKSVFSGPVFASNTILGNIGAPLAFGSTVHEEDEERSFGQGGIDEKEYEVQEDHPVVREEQLGSIEELSRQPGSIAYSSSSAQTRV